MSEVPLYHPKLLGTGRPTRGCVPRISRERNGLCGSDCLVVMRGDDAVVIILVSVPPPHYVGIKAPGVERICHM